MLVFAVISVVGFSESLVFVVVSVVNSLVSLVSVVSFIISVISDVSFLSIGSLGDSVSHSVEAKLVVESDLEEWMLGSVDEVRKEEFQIVEVCTLEVTNV